MWYTRPLPRSELDAPPTAKSACAVPASEVVRFRRLAKARCVQRGDASSSPRQMIAAFYTCAIAAVDAAATPPLR